jgi:hypothetical protein
MHMSIDLDKVRVISPRWPDETPYWPCALFLYGDEIVAALWYEQEGEAEAFEFDEYGVLESSPEPSPGGWFLHILADSTSPSPRDPRVQAPNIDVVGEATPVDAIQAAYETIENRAHPRGLSYQQSLDRLAWRRISAGGDYDR